MALMADEVEMDEVRRTSSGEPRCTAGLEAGILANDSVASSMGGGPRGGTGDGPGGTHGDPKQLYLLIAGSALGFMLFGYDTGVVSGASKWAQEDLNMTDFERGVAVAVTPWSAAAATLPAAACNAALGRRGVITLCAALYCAGAVMIAASNGFSMLAAARVVLGAAIGLATTTIPLYVAESAPRRHRGRIGTFNDFSIVFGQVVAGLTNIFAESRGRAWRWSMGGAVVPAAVQLLILPFLYESPRWLAMAGRQDEARAAFEAVNGTITSARVELAELVATAEEDRARRRRERTAAGEDEAKCPPCICKSGVEAYIDMWRDTSVRRAMLVGVFMMTMNQASGINTVMYYSTSILMAAGFDEEHAIWGAMFCDVTQLLGVSVSLFYIDRIGRRFLAKASAYAVSPSIFCLGLAFLFDLKMAAVVAMAIYLFSFGIGLSGVPWTVNAEIYPGEYRTAAQAQAIFTNWFLNGSIALLFPMFVDSAPEVFFFIFAIIAGLGGWWIDRYLPETKGLSLEAIEAIFRAPLRDSVAYGALGGADQRSWVSDGSGAADACELP